MVKQEYLKVEGTERDSSFVKLSVAQRSIQLKKARHGKIGTEW